MENVIFATTPESMARDGLTETVALWEDGLRTDIDSPAFEWWYFDAQPSRAPASRRPSMPISMMVPPL